MRTEHAKDIDTTDWWPCACVKGGGNGKPSTHIKLHHPSRRKCRVCGATREDVEALNATKGHGHD